MCDDKTFMKQFLNKAVLTIQVFGMWIGKLFLVIQRNWLLLSSEFYSPRRAARFSLVMTGRYSSLAD